MRRLKFLITIMAIAAISATATFVISGEIGYRRGFCARHFVDMTDDRGVTYHIDTQTGDDSIHCKID